MQPLTININDDNIVECDEMFNVTIVPVTTCGVTIGSNRISEVMIRDDDGKYRFFICSFCYIIAYHHLVNRSNSVTEPITIFNSRK